MSDSFFLARRRWMDPWSVLRLQRLGPPRLVHSKVVPEFKLRALRERRPHPWIIWLAFMRANRRRTMIKEVETTCGETEKGEWVRVYVAEHPGYQGAFEIRLLRGQMIVVRCDYVGAGVVDDVKARLVELGKTWCDPRREPATPATTVVE